MNKKKKKIDGVNVLCYLGIVILIIITALPPVLRLVMPKEEEVIIQDKLTLLSCSKNEVIEGKGLTTTYRTVYKNDKFDKLTINYVLDLEEKENEGSTDIEYVFPTIPLLEEFRETGLFTTSQSEREITSVLEVSKLTGKDTSVIKDYIGSITDVKAFYMGNEYKCFTTES